MKIIAIPLITLLMVAGLNINSNKELLDIEKVKGDYSDLGNVGLLYEPKVDIINNRRITLSKDGIMQKSRINNKKNRKIENSSLYRNFVVNYDELYKCQNDENMYAVKFVNKKVLGEIKYDVSVIKIDVINKKTLKKQTKIINLEDKYRDIKIDVKYTDIYKNKLYSLIEYENKKKEKVCLIVEINLDTQSYKVLANSNIIHLKEEDRFGNDSIIFLYGKKIYIETFGYSDHGEYTKFAVYDLENNKITYTNGFMNEIEDMGNHLNKNIFDYNIKDDVLQVVVYKDEAILEILKYKIKDNNIDFIGVSDCKLDMKYKKVNFDENNLKIKLVDNKLCVLKVDNIEKCSSKNTQISKGLKDLKFYVYDINKKESIFEAKLLNADKDKMMSMYFIGN